MCSSDLYRRRIFLVKGYWLPSVGEILYCLVQRTCLLASVVKNGSGTNEYKPSFVGLNELRAIRKDRRGDVVNVIIVRGFLVFVGLAIASLSD